jgi:hypothetical protein
MSQPELHFMSASHATPSSDDVSAAVDDFAIGDAFAFETPTKPAAEIFALTDEDSDLWLGIDPATGRPVRVPDEWTAIAGFRVVRRKLNSALAMIARGHDTLVNGLPALRLTVLAPRDSVVLAPGAALAYVTERLKPYIGPPTAEMIAKKQKCPYCRIPFSDTPASRVVTCRCLATFHHEDQHSHPDTPPKDRLDCLSKIKACLSCNRPITLEESLVFDPGNW